MMGTAGGEKSGVIVSTEVTVSTSGWDWAWRGCPF